MKTCFTSKSWQFPTYIMTFQHDNVFGKILIATLCDCFLLIGVYISRGVDFRGDTCDRLVWHAARTRQKLMAAYSWGAVTLRSFNRNFRGICDSNGSIFVGQKLPLTRGVRTNNEKLKGKRLEQLWPRNKSKEIFTKVFRKLSRIFFCCLYIYIYIDLDLYCMYMI